MSKESIPEREIEELAAKTGHNSFLALARWLRGNREALTQMIAAQDRVLADLVRELREVKADGKETKAQAKLTNGRVGAIEQARAIEAALLKERQLETERLRVQRAAELEARERGDRERAASRSDWEKLAAGAFFGAVGIGFVTLVLHLVGVA